MPLLLRGTSAPGVCLGNYSGTSTGITLAHPAELRGEFRLSSSPGKGTQVRLSIPTAA